jgi:F-box and WD-40 domain protein CDC4
VLDDAAWKALCEDYLYRKPNDDIGKRMKASAQNVQTPGTSPFRMQFGYRPSHLTGSGFNSTPDLRTQSVDRFRSQRHTRTRRPPPMSYRSHFKQRYMVDSAWKHGGKMHNCHITPDHGVVTSLHLTEKYIVVALDNAKIHVFNTDGEHQKTLQGHVMGVWAMVPWDDILVSGGCDRDVRVWNMETGASVHTLRGHTSTVRCLKMADSKTAISGSRDTTLRVWDIEKGICKHVLVGHGSSVRCLELHGDLVVSGSYDTTAKIWSISEGKCLKTLTGHFSQIYAIAFDGKKIATGSLDTMVRIWDIEG